MDGIGRWGSNHMLGYLRAFASPAACDGGLIDAPLGFGQGAGFTR